MPVKSSVSSSREVCSLPSFGRLTPAFSASLSHGVLLLHSVDYRSCFTAVVLNVFLIRYFTPCTSIFQPFRWNWTRWSVEIARETPCSVTMVCSTPNAQKHHFPVLIYAWEKPIDTGVCV